MPIDGLRYINNFVVVATSIATTVLVQHGDHEVINTRHHHCLHKITIERVPHETSPGLDLESAVPLIVKCVDAVSE